MVMNFLFVFSVEMRKYVNIFMLQHLEMSEMYSYFKDRFLEILKQTLFIAI